MTRIFEFPLAVSGSGPYISMAIHLKGAPDLTMVMGFFVVLPPGPLALTHPALGQSTPDVCPHVVPEVFLT